MTAPDGHIAALSAIVGEKGLLTDPREMEPYETGARYDRGRAAFVVRPRSTEEVSAVVSICARAGIALVPQSGNTGLVSGSTPDLSGSQGILSLDRLTGTFALDRDNRSLTASAGIRLADVNARLAPDGLFFPIDLSANPALGGMVSTNTGGSRFLKYGDVRHNVLGLTVVLADEAGTVLRLGGPLRKNNTGVDWKHLFIGSCGAFGIVTECVLNLERLPRQVATAYLVPASRAHVMPLLAAMEERLGAYLSAFEGMSRAAITAALAHAPSLRNPFSSGEVPDYVILAEISRTWTPRAGEPPLDDVMQSVLAEILESDGTPLADAFVGPEHEMWALRHALSEGVKHSGRLIAFDVSFRRGDIMSFCDRMAAEMPANFPEVSICDFGHVGDGGVHFNLVVPRDGPAAADPDFERRLRDFVYRVAVEDYGGSFSAEHGVGRKNQIYYDHYTDTTLKDLARELKAIMSPAALGTVRYG